MRIVAKAQQRPNCCCVFPHIGSAQPEGYFQTGSTLPGPGAWDHEVYVSVVAVKEMARELGWISDPEAGVLRDEIAQLQSDLAEVTERADAAEAVVDAIDVIESAEFKARKRAGRPKPKEAVA